MTQTHPSRRSRRDTRRHEVSAAARALRGEAPVVRERRGHGAVARHDLAVVAILALLFSAGTATHRALAAPGSTTSEHGALRLSRPDGWLPASRIDTPSPPVARAALTLGGAEESAAGDGAERWTYAFPADPITRIELEIRPRPPYSNLPAALALTRAIRYGERYGARATEARAIAGRDWYRTAFRYPYGGVRTPRLAEAVEYAAPSGDELYVVTLHGDARSVDALERAVAPTLTLSAERAQRGGSR